ncbi:hypothetical protein ACQPXH_06740 [Nocardia sp. CA-135953]|uniref:hypothetical protein n=1 Tax=Nocardia sp. CA-135953 TaxID=3239978 RepID=UPI003D98C358
MTQQTIETGRQQAGRERGIGYRWGAIDAALVRSIMVPALMKLCGTWNWWLPGSGTPVRVEVSVRTHAPAQAGSAPDVRAP